MRLFLTKCSLHRSLTVLSLSFLGLSTSLKAGTDTWTTSTGSVTDGNGSWTATSTNFYNTTTNVEPLAGDTIQIGSTVGGFTITLAQGRDLYYYGSNLNINQNYTIDASSTSDGLWVGGTTTIAAGKTAVFNGLLETSNTTLANSATLATTFTVTGGGNLGTVSGNATGVASVINIGGMYGGGYVTDEYQVYALNGSATGSLTANIAPDTTVQLAHGIGTGQTTGNTVLNVGSAATTGAVLDLNSTNLQLGVGNATAGTDSAVATLNVWSGNEISNNNATGYIGFGATSGSPATTNGGNAILNVNGGTLFEAGVMNVGTIQNTNNIVTDVFNIGGGIVYVKGLTLGSANTYIGGSTATVNLSGGTLYIGTTTSSAVTGTGLTDAFKFSGGILAAGGSSTFAIPITLSSTGGTIQTQAVDGNSTNLTVTGVISGVGNLTKTGIGTLNLEAANTFTGNTIVDAGTLSIGGGASGTIAGGSLTINFGAVSLANSASGVIQTFTGTTIGGGLASIGDTTSGNTLNLGLLTNATGGTVNFVNTTGAVTVNNATLNSSLSNGIIGAWATTGASYATDSGAVGNDNVTAFTSSAAGANFASVTGTTGNYTLAVAEAASSSLTMNTLQSTGVGVGTSLGVNNLTVNGLMSADTSGTWTISSTTGQVIIGSTKVLDITGNSTGSGITISAPIVDSGSGSSSLVDSDIATLTLSGADTYSGNTYLNAGTLVAGIAQNGTTSGPLGTGAGGASTSQIVFNGGVLEYSASNNTDYSSRIVNSLGAINLNLNSQTVTFANSLASSNTGGLTLSTSAGELVLSAANSYTGLTTISGGATLQLSGSGTLGATTNALDIASGTLDLNETNQTVGSLYGGGSIVNPLGTTNNIESVLTVGNGATGAGSTGSNFTYSGSLVGYVGITKVGAGSVLTLSGAISGYSGTTTVNAGQITYSGSESFDYYSTVVVNDGGSILLAANGVGIEESGGYVPTITIAGYGSAFSSDAIYDNAYTNTISGDITLTDNSAIGVANGGALTIGGSLASVINNNGYNLQFDASSGTINVYSGISGSGGIIREGTTPTAVVALYGYNFYTGDTIILTGGGGSGGGIFQAETSYAFGLNSALIINTPAAGTQSGVDLNGNNITFGSIAEGTIAASARGLSAITLGGATLTVGTDNTNTTFGGAIFSSSPLIASTGGGFIKQGTGTLTLNGDNQYSFTGTTEVSGGKLVSIGVVAPAGQTLTQPVGTGSPPSYTTIGTTTVELSVGDTTLYVGELVSGTGIPAGTYITAFGSTISTGISNAGTVLVTLSQPVTTGASLTATFGATQGLGGGPLLIDNASGVSVDVSGDAGGTYVASLAGGGAAGGSLSLGATTFTLNGTGIATAYNGVISGTAGSNFVMAATGTETLGGTNTYIGTTTLTSGNLAISAAANLGANTNNLVFNGGTLELKTGTVALAATTTPSIMAGTTGTVQVDPGASLTVNGSIASTTGAFTKSGTGSLTLSGTNAYTGATTVNAGTLTITNGTLASTGMVNINGGSLLFGTGHTGTLGSGAGAAINLNVGATIGFTGQAASTSLVAPGALTLSGSTGTAIITFGSSVGTGDSITFNSLQGLSSTSTLSIYDYNIGSLTLTPTGSLQTDTGNTNDRLLFTTTTGIGYNPNTEVLFYSNNGTTLIGYGYEVMFGTGYEIVPGAIAVPEPSTYLMGFGLLGLVAYTQRRQLMRQAKLAWV